MLEVGAALSHEQRLVIFAAHPPETSDLAPIMCWIGRGTRVSSLVDEVYLDHPRGLVAFPRAPSYSPQAGLTFVRRAKGRGQPKPEAEIFKSASSLVSAARLPPLNQQSSMDSRPIASLTLGVAFLRQLPGRQDHPIYRKMHVLADFEGRSPATTRYHHHPYRMPKKRKA